MGAIAQRLAVIIQQVSFAAPAESGENVLTSEKNGLLSTVLFRRVFISYADRFVVLDHGRADPVLDAELPLKRDYR